MATPHITDPPLSGTVIGFKTTSNTYVLTINANWIEDGEMFIFDATEYYFNDEVEILGETTIKLDINLNEYTELEIISIKKVTTYCGKIIAMPMPAISNSPIPGLVYGIETASNDYVLIINSFPIVVENQIIVDGVEYFEEDDVEITGIATTYLDNFSEEYHVLEVISIEKPIGLESVSLNKYKVYYDRTSQCIVLERTLQDQPLTFELLDIHGKVIMRKTGIGNNNSIPVTDLLSGIYLYRLMQNGQVINSDKLFIGK